MPKLTNSSITAKNGLNFLKNIVEKNGSIFHKIELENDFGIDGIIEFFDKGIPTNISIAFQIKSGNSYINKDESIACIPIDDHLSYWKEYALPVFGFVYNPDIDCGYWINIKEYLRHFPENPTIQIRINRTNTLNNHNYKALFFPQMIKKILYLNLADAIDYFDSDNEVEHELGVSTLFHNHINDKETWNAFINYLIEKPIELISNRLIYYIAHIPWHGDIGYWGEPISEKVTMYARNKISNFDEITTIKLLGLIDPENGMQRGTIGQSVEAIISCIYDKEEKLKHIIKDNKLENNIRYYAAFIFAYYNPSALVFLNTCRDIEGVDDLAKYLYENGELNIYA